VIDAGWRLFVGRYIFTSYIAYLLLEKKFTLKTYSPLIILGILYMIVHRYELLNLQPWFYTADSFPWRGVNFPTYYYSGFLFFIFYKYLPCLHIHIKSGLKYLGQNSWEIFLGQMLFFTIFPMRHNLTEALLHIPIAISFSLIAAYLYISFSTGKWKFTFTKRF
jgi:hypothetical protein